MTGPTSNKSTCLYDVYLGDPYNANNQSGIIDLSTAENRLVSDLVMPAIQRHVCLKDPSILNYQLSGGSTSLRDAFKGFMEQVCKGDIKASRLTMVSGAELAVQSVLQAVCKPGDKVAVVVPCYAGFTKMIERLGLDQFEIVHDLSSGTQLPDITKEVRAVLISNPDVPTGHCWSSSALQALINSTRTYCQHLIVDEVVSTAVVREGSFTSAACFAEDHVHVISGLSKIGMAGLRIGAIYSSLPRALMTGLARVAQIGSIEQNLAANLLCDKAFMKVLLETSRDRLRVANAIAACRLEAERIESKLGSAGLTVLLNLGAGSSAHQLITDAKVFLRDLTEYGSRRHGWYRMAVADDSQVVATAIQRLGTYLRQHSPLSLLPAYKTIFVRLWKRTDELWRILQADPQWAHCRPIQLRHPFVFYVGHLPAFAMNQVCLALGEDNVKRANVEYDCLFERGIDPDVLSGEVHPHSADINQSSWPSISEINRYVEAVHQNILQSLPKLLVSGQQNTVEMILEHEFMHQETLIYMMAQCEPSRLQCPTFVEKLPASGHKTTQQRACRIPAGVAVLGGEGSVLSPKRFGWDNEFPKTIVNVCEFEVMALPVSNKEFFRFIEEGGYTTQSLWTERQWEWLQAESIAHPASWKYDEASRQWLVRVSLFDYSQLDQVLEYPVMVSHAEASAYCRFVGARIMTEPEYHRAAYGNNPNQPYPWGYLPPEAVDANVGFRCWSLRPSGLGNTESCFGVADLVGQAWEWTSSKFSPLDQDREFVTMPTYTGYSSEFFDGNHVVMKGGSWATDVSLLRPSFRNWYQDCYHYSFAKFRLVNDPNICSTRAEASLIRLTEAANPEERRKQFASDIVAGLTSKPKTIRSIHFYDNRGSEIYAKITELDEYYLTRTEAAILESSAGQILGIVRDHQLRHGKRIVNVVEFGAGDGRKTIPLLDRLYENGLNLCYYPIDISEGALRSLEASLQSHDCKFQSKSIVGDNIHALDYLSKEANEHALTLVLFLGSSIGNYDAVEARRLLKSMRSKLQPGDMAMVGFDLVKSTATLLPAYDDSKGVTAEFNYNLIRRLDIELNAQIPQDAFSHYATYNPTKQRMESYLIATKPLQISLRASPGERGSVITFDAWEPIHVENSYKYTLKDIEALAKQTGFRVCQNLLDENLWFSETIFDIE